MGERTHCNKSKRKSKVPLVGLLLLLSACAGQTTPPSPDPMVRDSASVPHAKTATFPIATHDTLTDDTPSSKPAHVETERERKERLYRELHQKKQNVSQGVPVFIYTDSAGRKLEKYPYENTPRVVSQ